MGEIAISGRPRDVAGADEPFARATTLPRAFYLDPELYRLEEERAIRAQWIPVARVEQVSSPGDYFAARLLDEQLLVTHDLQGELRVLSNVCRHRSMVLASGQGNCKILRCSYHLWSYRLDGSLSGAPMMAGTEGFAHGDVSLPEIRHEVWQGWIMVNLSGTAPSLSTLIPSLSGELAGWDFPNLRLVGSSSYECAWNWKIIVENFCEPYHHLGLHRESLEPFLPARDARWLDNGGEPWNSVVFGCTEDYLGIQGEPMPGLDTELAQTMQIFTVFPFLCAGAQGSSAFWLSVTPLSVDRSIVTWHVLVRPEQAEQPDLAEFVEASLSAINVLQVEDGEACRSVQAGLASPSSAPGRLANAEMPIWQFQRWLLASLADTAVHTDADADAAAAVEAAR